MIESYSRYRWLIAIMLFSGLIGLNVLWFIPSPLLTVIMDDLSMNLTQGGLGMSIVCLLVGIFSLIGGMLINRIGVKQAFLYGLMLMAAGASFTYFAGNYAGLFFTRVVIGTGFGLCLPVTGVIIMMWFPQTERPYMNTINSAIPYLATIITFSLTIPIFHMLNDSWRMTIVLWGVIMGIVAICWFLCGKNRSGADISAETGAELEKGLYRTVWKNREVRLLTVAVTCDLFSFQFLTSMLPTFYTLEEGMNMESASSLTTIFPIAGLIAGLVCGVWMTKIGLRRPFTYPMHIMIFIGTSLAIFGTGWIRVLGIAMAGFGNAGWAPALLTMPMEFDNITPNKVGAVYGIMWSMAYLAAFISPWLGGSIAESISLRYTILLISFSSLIAAYCTFRMKETGPRAAKHCSSAA